MVRAIIFDCFGVLSTEGWLPFKKKHFGNQPQLLNEVDDLGKQRDAGMLSYEEFYASVAERGNVPVSSLRQAFTMSVPNDDLLDFIARELEPNYKIGMLSNTGANQLHRLFSQEIIELFDAISLSFETGLIKPDPRAYRTIAERLGVEPSECVFIDDQKRYCTAACEQGMQAIVYTSLEQFKQDLPPLLAKA